jgi:cell division protein FtsZ
MGIGQGVGEERAEEAARAAISSPLLEASIEGAKGLLLSISGGSDLTLHEVHRAAEAITRAAHPEANIIFGAVIDDALGDECRVTVIAAGFDRAAESAFSRPPVGISSRQPESITLSEDEEDIPVPSLLKERQEDEDLFQPAHVGAGRNETGDDDLDIPDFLKG